MIRVTIYKNEKHQCVGFKAHGHAGFSEEGQDIVCAAVSVLTINTLNAIEKFADDRTSLVSDESKGLIDYRLKGNPTREAQLLLDAMVLGLEEIAEDENYREYMDLTYEEV
ncbi:ribosomal-processing cysteine protease Prp [Coprococcus comes]|uniref:ribosomal-processing cysteine protease Prp n=1 Tax=Coprococcus comes TaxID=410072 RepID=UPI001899F6BB|nr:ribosomal-processing cysteine protease Prp [Coprococcus comes]